MKYNDPQHVKNYEEGTFPKIHDMIYSFIVRYADRTKPALEVGSCFGLISARMIDNKIVPKVIAFEPSQSNLSLAIKKPEIEYYKKSVSLANMSGIFKIMKDNEVKTIVARRVFPEIANKHGIETVKKFGQAAAKAGVQLIILEGRKKTINPTTKLQNADLEAEALKPFYKVVEAYKDIRVLEMVKDQ